MATMLELPRELYLMICAYLTPKELIRLTGVSRDHYLAVQQPLFEHVKIKSFDSLVKLLSTMVRNPVVSHISPKQRKYWFKLSDAQLRERDVKTLQIQLDSRNDTKIVGAILERCINGIVHKCPEVNITLTLNSVWRNGLKQLEAASLPNVKDLSMFVSGEHMDRADNELLLKHKHWDVIFSGLTFPDLKNVNINTLCDYAKDAPSTASDSLSYHYNARHRHFFDNAGVLDGNTFYGLLKMEKISIQYSSLLSSQVLNELFNSRIIPRRLTTLEIVNCPHLHPVDDVAAIAILLQRGLQLLQLLKLHLTSYDPYGSRLGVFNYNAEIDEHPEHHLCNIVRELGKNIKSLDLAIPFACKHIFTAPNKKVKIGNDQRAELQLPTISQQPLNTLQQRLVAAGYKYRRLITYNGICHGAHDWDELSTLAINQGGNVSWDLLSEIEGRAIWCVSGCLPVERSWEDALAYPLLDDEDLHN